MTLSTKKRTIILISALLVLGGTLWYLNTTGMVMNMSSSVLNPPKTFSCNENNLKQYQSTYKKTLLREKRARVLLKKIESEIEKLKKSDPENQ